MKKFVVVIIVLLMFTSNVYANSKIEVSLVKCVDGDTAYFLVDGEEKKFRFLAIDTPESVHPTKGVESGGKEASEYTCELLTNASKIEVLYDEKGSSTDKYGRELAWIYIDDVLLQETLISEGYAEVAYVYYNYSFIESLCEVQKDAIENKLGIWSDNTRVEGYCSTKSNSKKTTIEETTTQTLSTEDIDKLIDYIIDGDLEKVIKLIMKNTTSIIIIVVLGIVLIIVKFSKKKKRK